jgi:GNAT superfamily N-acetyltransferase
VIPELERAEAEAFASAMSAAGRPVCRLAGAVCYATPGVSNTQASHVLALGVEREPTDAELDEIEAFFREHDAPCAVSIAPGRLHERLMKRGYEVGYAWMKFSRDASAAVSPPSELSVDETTDHDAFERTITAAFEAPAGAVRFDGLAGQPGWTLFLARAGDEPAGAAALFVHAGVGWLGIAGTVPEHRGKGAQSALLAARIARGRELGVHAFTTETGERVPDRPSASYRNILRAGFEEAYLRQNLLAPK